MALAASSKPRDITGGQNEYKLLDHPPPVKDGSIIEILGRSEDNANIGFEVGSTLAVHDVGTDGLCLFYSFLHRSTRTDAIKLRSDCYDWLSKLPEAETGSLEGDYIRLELGRLTAKDIRNPEFYPTELTVDALAHVKKTPIVLFFPLSVNEQRKNYIVYGDLNWSNTPKYIINKGNYHFLYLELQGPVPWMTPRRRPTKKTMKDSPRTRARKQGRGRIVRSSVDGDTNLDLGEETSSEYEDNDKEEESAEEESAEEESAEEELAEEESAEEEPEFLDYGMIERDDIVQEDQNSTYAVDTTMKLERNSFNRENIRRKIKSLCHSNDRNCLFEKVDIEENGSLETIFDYIFDYMLHQRGDQGSQLMCAWKIDDKWFYGLQRKEQIIDIIRLGNTEMFYFCNFFYQDPNLTYKTFYGAAGKAKDQFLHYLLEIERDLDSYFYTVNAEKNDESNYFSRVDEISRTHNENDIEHDFVSLYALLSKRKIPGYEVALKNKRMKYIPFTQNFLDRMKGMSFLESFCYGFYYNLKFFEKDIEINPHCLKCNKQRVCAICQLCRIVDEIDYSSTKVTLAPQEEDEYVNVYEGKPIPMMKLKDFQDSRKNLFEDDVDKAQFTFHSFATVLNVHKNDDDDPTHYDILKISYNNASDVGISTGLSVTSQTSKQNVSIQLYKVPKQFVKKSSKYEKSLWIKYKKPKKNGKGKKTYLCKSFGLGRNKYFEEHFSERSRANHLKQQELSTYIKNEGKDSEEVVVPEDLLYDPDNSDAFFYVLDPLEMFGQVEKFALWKNVGSNVPDDEVEYDEEEQVTNEVYYTTKIQNILLKEYKENKVLLEKKMWLLFRNTMTSRRDTTAMTSLFITKMKNYCCQYMFNELVSYYHPAGPNFFNTNKIENKGFEQTIGNVLWFKNITENKEINWRDIKKPKGLKPSEKYAKMYNDFINLLGNEDNTTSFSIEYAADFTLDFMSTIYNVLESDNNEIYKADIIKLELSKLFYFNDLLRTKSREEAFNETYELVKNNYFAIPSKESMQRFILDATRKGFCNLLKSLNKQLQVQESYTYFDNKQIPNTITEEDDEKALANRFTKAYKSILTSAISKQWDDYSSEEKACWSRSILNQQKVRSIRDCIVYHNGLSSSPVPFAFKSKSPRIEEFYGNKILFNSRTFSEREGSNTVYSFKEISVLDSSIFNKWRYRKFNGPYEATSNLFRDSNKRSIGRMHHILLQIHAIIEDYKVQMSRGKNDKFFKLSLQSIFEYNSNAMLEDVYSNMSETQKNIKDKTFHIYNLAFHYLMFYFKKILKQSVNESRAKNYKPEMILFKSLNDYYDMYVTNLSDETRNNVNEFKKAVQIIFSNYEKPFKRRKLHSKKVIVQFLKDVYKIKGRLPDDFKRMEIIRSSRLSSLLNGYELGGEGEGLQINVNNGMENQTIPFDVVVQLGEDDGNDVLQNYVLGHFILLAFSNIGKEEEQKDKEGEEDEEEEDEGEEDEGEEDEEEEDEGEEDEGEEDEKGYDSFKPETWKMYIYTMLKLANYNMFKLEIAEYDEETLDMQEEEQRSTILSKLYEDFRRTTSLNEKNNEMYAKEFKKGFDGLYNLYLVNYIFERMSFTTNDVRDRKAILNYWRSNLTIGEVYDSILDVEGTVEFCILKVIAARANKVLKEKEQIFKDYTMLQETTRELIHKYLLMQKHNIQTYTDEPFKNVYINDNYLESLSIKIEHKKNKKGTEINTKVAKYTRLTAFIQLVETFKIDFYDFLSKTNSKVLDQFKTQVSKENPKSKDAELDNLCFEKIKSLFKMSDKRCSFCKTRMDKMNDICNICNNEWNGFENCKNKRKNGRVCNGKIFKNLKQNSRYDVHKHAFGFNAFCDSCFYEVERYVSNTQTTFDSTYKWPFQRGEHCFEVSDKRIQLCRKTSFESSTFANFLGYEFCLSCYCQPTEKTFEELMVDELQNSIIITKDVIKLQSQLETESFKSKLTNWLSNDAMDEDDDDTMDEDDDDAMDKMKTRLLNAKFVHEYCKFMPIKLFPSDISVEGNYSSFYKINQETDNLYMDYTGPRPYNQANTSSKAKQKRGIQKQRKDNGRIKRSPQSQRTPQSPQKRRRRKAIDDIEESVLKLVF